MYFFFSSRRRHTRYWRDWIQTCALPIFGIRIVLDAVASFGMDALAVSVVVLAALIAARLSAVAATIFAILCFAFLMVLGGINVGIRSEEHTSEIQSRQYLVCRLLLEKKNKKILNLFKS